MMGFWCDCKQLRGTLAFLLLTALCIDISAAQQAEGWKEGRATYYAAPEAISKAYDPCRGQGSFGILAYGACGYTNLPGGDLPFPKETYAASADADADYPGSCGRCYEIRCKSGLVLGNGRQPIRLVTLTAEQSGETCPPLKGKVAYFDGDKFRPYLVSINPNVTDEQGRKFPGNPAEKQGNLYVQCYDENKSIRIRIADSCPCKQVLSETAPGVKKGGEVRRQEWCCGPVQHFDISYWAFQQLAHPVNGAMMLQYRPVDCDTGAPLPANYISSAIYDGNSKSGIQPGWSWYPYEASSANLLVSGGGPSGGLATCVKVGKKGGLSFTSRQAGQPGFQPFKGKTSLQFQIKPNSGSTDPAVTSTPTGQVPPLKLFLMNQEEGRYCGAEPVLGDTVKPTKQNGDWYQFQIPLSAFKCEGNYPQEKLDRLDFQNTQEKDAAFCLTDVRLL